jgi:hypothetical protein
MVGSILAVAVVGWVVGWSSAVTLLAFRRHAAKLAAPPSGAARDRRPGVHPLPELPRDDARRRLLPGVRVRRRRALLNLSLRLQSWH